jgi:hypothetical protein
MGTTLTGTTPATTYDSLIKVTDNGPLSGTAKYLSDGLGNDSVLALSTSAIGVGNAAPAYKLDVTGDIRTSVASGNGSLYINNSSLTSKFWTFIPETAAGETNLLFFYGGTGAGTKMTITNAGNVGIGTSSPTAGKLQIEGVGSSGAIRLNHSASNSFIYSTISNGDPIAFDNALGDLAIYTGLAERMRITSAGNVGIGTSSAAAKMQVLSDRFNDSLTFNASAGLIIGSTIRQLAINSNDTAPYDMSMQAKTNGGTASNLILQSLGGNVGIGINNPTFRLEAHLTTNTDSSQSIARFAAKNAAAEIKTLDVGYTGSDNLMTIGTNAVGTDPSIAVKVGSSEVARFTSAGNVGIGTTSPSAKLHVSSSADVEVKLNSSAGAYTSKLTLDAAGGGSSVIDARSATQPRLIFQNNGTYIASITSGGICFNYDTAEANALDDYEEGTWTPVISDGTNNATMTPTYNEGKYVKVGKMVHLSAYVLTDSLGSVTGNIRITGLPFTNSSGFGFLVGGIAGAGGNLNLTAGQNVTLTISTASNYIILNVWDATTGTNPMTASQWSADGQMQIGITYLAA